MNDFEVLTLRDIDFTDDKGNRVVGKQLYVQGLNNENGWHDYEVVKFWFPDNHRLMKTVSGLKHGDIVTIRFNYRGRPDYIEVQ